MDDKKRSYYNAQGKLVLPQVTLCAMDSVQVRATLKAMEYSMKDIVFADAVIITDKKPLFIMLEDRYQMIPNIMAVRVRSIPELMSLIAKLKTPKAKELYSCIVIDTIDKLDSMLENYVATSKEVEITAELGFGTTSMGKG